MTTRARTGAAPAMRLFRSRPLTTRERARVRRAIGRKRFPVKQCFYNAQRLATADPTFRYAEGHWWTVLADRWFCIHHAWVVVNGKVVDPTCGVLGVIPPSSRYRGRTFSARQAAKHVVRTRLYGSLMPDTRVYFDGWQPTGHC